MPSRAPGRSLYRSHRGSSSEILQVPSNLLHQAHSISTLLGSRASTRAGILHVHAYTCVCVCPVMCVYMLEVVLVPASKAFGKSKARTDKLFCILGSHSPDTAILIKAASDKEENSQGTAHHWEGVATVPPAHESCNFSTLLPRRGSCCHLWSIWSHEVSLAWRCSAAHGHLSPIGLFPGHLGSLSVHLLGLMCSLNKNKV